MKVPYSQFKVRLLEDMVAEVAIMDMIINWKAPLMRYHLRAAR